MTRGKLRQQLCDRIDQQFENKEIAEQIKKLVLETVRMTELNTALEMLKGNFSFYSALEDEPKE